jgi:large subunit ribosomal protein L5
MSNALKEQYETVAAELMKQWQKSNRLEIPRLEKIVVNVGFGSHKDDKAYKELVQNSLARITGQQPVVTAARLSIAGFKLREGQEIGAKVTLRGRRMEDFCYRLVNIVLPRVRDFRGLSPQAFDGHGNYSIGLREHTVFPEISYEDVTQTHPLEITVVTTTDSDDEARELLARLGFPFQGREPQAEPKPESAGQVGVAKEDDGS